MRKMKFLLVFTTLILSTGITANESEKVNFKDPLSKQIAEILSENSFRVKNQDVTARVLFTLNEENRIQVLNVETKHLHLKRFIEKSLRSQKVEFDNTDSDEEFVINIRMTKP